MRPKIDVPVYRPRQKLLAKEKSQKNTQGCAFLPRPQWKQLSLMVVVALVIGLGLTQFFHVRMLELQAKVGQIQVRISVIAAENQRLVNADVQVTSTTQVVALAERKLKLFEPNKEQVRRM